MACATALPPPPPPLLLLLLLLANRLHCCAAQPARPPEPAPPPPPKQPSPLDDILERIENSVRGPAESRSDGGAEEAAREHSVRCCPEFETGTPTPP
eukprot:SAG31_NODE_3147_length_4620_cov_1.523114_5_plen_97_part_00